MFASGKRSYVIQYRSAGRSRRYTIGLHGVWTPELARQEAKVQLGRVAQGDNPAEERQLDHKAITVKELCDLYLNDLKAGLILGKGGRPKKATTIVTDTGRIHRHIMPLIGTRRVKDLVKADVNKVLKDIMAGKTRVSVKTKKLRGKAIVRGGAGTATRTVGLLGGILTYAVEAGIIELNPAHGIRKPKDNVRNRRLTEAEYRTLGEILRNAAEDDKYQMTVDIIRQIALTGCRRTEMITLRWVEADTDASCLRLIDSKEGASTRPIGLPVVEYLESRQDRRCRHLCLPRSGRRQCVRQLSQSLGEDFRGHAACRYHAARAAAQLRKHRERPWVHRGHYRGLGRPRQGLGYEQIHPHARHRAHHGGRHDLRLHPWADSTASSSSRPPTRSIAIPGRRRLPASFARPPGSRPQIEEEQRLAA